MPVIDYQWKGRFGNEEVNQLHAEAFQHRVFSAEEWDWVSLCEDHSMGWVTARDHQELLGFVNVLWDGLVHAWVQDVMVSPLARRQGIGVGLLDVVRNEARAAGCEWLHVDFDDNLRRFYYDAAGFAPTNGGLIHLAGEE
ncbi:MAG TPA: GNAT family N-acetyltransferase [Acidimicrobiia bacterium]|nr:GNAT family N-acetyltransferase [Acidimicrobiia bacterium]